MARIRMKVDPAEARERLDWKRLNAKSDAEIQRGIEADPDAQLSPLDHVRIMWRLNKLAPIKKKLRLLRRALKMSQADFAEAYGIPLPTLQKWEQGGREPDEAALSYLQVIAQDPRKIMRLRSASRPRVA